MYFFLSRNELKHYGVLGMKWGVRKYQNKDGSLTAAGKRRYLSRDEKKARRDKRDALYKELNSEADREYNYHKKKLDAIERKKADVAPLQKNYVRDTTVGAAIAGATLGMSAAAEVTSKYWVASGKERAALILATGFGGMAVASLIGAVSSSRDVSRAAKKYGID